jgi:TonB-linked SusC/RagA family outer membrane protein
MKKLIYLSLGVMLAQLPQCAWAQEADADSTSNFTAGLIHIKNKTNTAAISTVSSKQLNSSEANPSNALYGQLAGLTVLQGDQVAWSNNPGFYIRGTGGLNDNTPLVLVDGYERSLNMLALEEIESISVLKDAATLSLYGVRGANGVLDVKTKRGKHAGLEVNVNLQTGLKKPFRLPKYADGYNYALALNEALTLDGLTPTYSSSVLEAFRQGTQPELYPSVDWVGETIRNQGSNREITASFSGGDERVKYYSLVNYVGDEGFLRQTDLNPDYNAQMIWDRLNLRTNLDAKLSKTTNLRLNLLGQIARHNRPTVNYGELFSTIYTVPSAAFPVKTETGNWGDNRIHANPLATLADRGYVTGNDRTLYADLTLQQDLAVWLEGLSAEASVAYDNRAAYWDVTDINRTLYGQNSALSFSSELGVATMLKALDGKLRYDRAWDSKHSLTSYLMYRMEEFSQNGRNNTIRRQSVLGNLNYGLSDKYFLDLAFSYAGSSVMSADNRFQFFPALSAAWVLSKEDFLANNEVVDLLKLRASWGITGSDRFAYELDRQYFVVGGTSYFFHANNKTFSGIVEGSLGNSDLQYEKSYKSNVGIEATLWKGLDITVDAFYDKRNNILVSASPVYSSVIGIGLPLLNQGEVKNYGVETQLKWGQQVGDWNYQIGGNFAFTRNEIVHMNEGYQPYDYLKREGNRVGQFFGLESIGYFKDDADIANSPAQYFSEVKAGDIKYKDQNGDQVINEYDEVAMGYSTLLPEIYYGFHFAVGYKNVRLQALFQGVANYSVIKNMDSYYWTLKDNNTVSQHYLDNRWTAENPNALYPRLTTLDNQNNFRNNSTWLANGAFLKLRNLDVTYTLPQAWSDKIKAKQIGVLARGTNLFSWDDIQDLDPELMYLSYPSYRSFHLGVNLTF